LIGVSYHGQGRLESAREHLLRARDLLLELQPERAYDLIKCRRLLATVTARLGDPERALEDLRRVHADAYATLSDDYPELGAVDSDLAWMLQETGALSESIPYGEAALARFVALGPDFAPMAAAAASNLVRTRRVSGSPEEIEAGYRQALELIAAAYGPRSVQAGVATSNLGNCLLGFGRLDEARALFEEALAVLRDALVGDHPTIAVTLYNLSALQQSAGELDAAERTARECLAANERLYGPDHPETLDAVVGLALILYERGELSAALEQFQLAADTRGRDLGPDDPSTVKALARALEVRCLLEAGPGGPGDPGGPDGDGGHQALLDLYARVAGDDELMRFVARAGARAFDELDPERAQAWRARAAASD